MTPRKTGVLVVAHGSRLPEAAEMMKRLVERLRPRLGATPIEPAFMEMAEPGISAAVERLVAQGCDHIFGYPLFPLPGRHLSRDIPALIEDALSGHAGVSWELAEPMLADPGLLAVIEQRIRRGVVPAAED